MLVLGNLEFRVVDKEFYCRYCDRYTPYCFRNHRSGLWFKVAVRNRNGKEITVVFGEGEREHRFPFLANVGELLYSGMSGCEDYEKGYVTCGGWFGLKGVLVDYQEEDTNIEPEMNEHEKIAFARMLNDYAKEIIKTLIDNDVTTTSDDWGLWNCYKPLFRVYEREKVIELPLGARIVEHGMSFNATFEFGKIKVRIPKGRYRIEEDSLIFTVAVGRTRVYYAKFFERNIVYLTKENWLHFLAWEEYSGHVHPMATISNEIPRAIDFLVKYRLGDILFIPRASQSNFEGKLDPATKEQFKKIKCLKGCIEFGEEIIVRGDDGIALYHPEHGLLELEAGEYIAYEVLYLRRGHD